MTSTVSFWSVNVHGNDPRKGWGRTGHLVRYDGTDAIRSCLMESKLLIITLKRVAQISRRVATTYPREEVQRHCSFGML